jgi:subtilisin family serine protease
VIIEFNALYPGGCKAARDFLLRQFLRERQAAGIRDPEAERIRLMRIGSRAPSLPKAQASIFSLPDELSVRNSLFTESYVFGRVTRETINRLASLQLFIGGVTVAPIYKIWADLDVRRWVFESIRTVKCDAARAAFAAAGRGVIWAVADTGIDGTHPHFATHDTLNLQDCLHRDFTEAYPSDKAAAEGALVDVDGHGTHVAGIIAGESLTTTAAGGPQTLRVTRSIRVDSDAPKKIEENFTRPISGMAPLCKILSLKVLKKGDKGSLSHVLAAVGYLQKLNENGRNIKVHGLNLSLGYAFDPEWFAAGQSPLCKEVDRLVRSGVTVVVAAGNSGYGTVINSQGQADSASHGGTIADPGNADLAITVGSTHRTSPHAFGISYFSAKGPTADGRMKPDLVAPGERIVSCAVTDAASKKAGYVPFKEDSGTSMAAPHVSGAAAAFLSVRGEFKGRPEELKKVLVGGAIDLKRRPEFQGAGLVDVMRALQSI